MPIVKVPWEAKSLRKDTLLLIISLLELNAELSTQYVKISCLCMNTNHD